MKLAKKMITGVLIAGFLAMLVALPQAAEADGRYGGSSGHGHSHGPGPFWGGVAVGAVTGIVVGSIFAPRAYAVPPVVYQPVPPPVVYQPAPAVVYQPVCTSYWVNTYWNGYQWVPGYWAQACR